MDEKNSNWKVPAIFDFIMWSENLNQVLESVRKDLGEKFVLEIFHHKFKVDIGNFNLLLYNSRYEEKFAQHSEVASLEFSERFGIPQEASFLRLGIRKPWNFSSSILVLFKPNALNFA